MHAGRILLPELVGSHTKVSPVPALVDDGSLSRGSGCTECHKKRHEMIRIGLRMEGRGRTLAVVYETVAITGRYCMVQPVVERDRPCIRGQAFPKGNRGVAKRVHRSPAANDKHSPGSEGRDGIPEGKVPGRIEMALDRELDNREPGIRVHQHQGHPGPMVEATPGIRITGNPRRRDKARNLLRKFR